MSCELGKWKHLRFKKMDRCFIQFWYEYFQSSKNGVRDLPIRFFLSAPELVDLCELSMCRCKNLVEKLFPGEKFVCKYCKESFSSLAKLENHNKQHKLEMNNFDCVFCTKSYPSRYTLIRHIELHTKEYECEVCGKAFHMYDLERHLKTRKHQKWLKLNGNVKKSSKS